MSSVAFNPTFRIKLLVGLVAIVAFAELLTVAALDRSVSTQLTTQLAKRLEDQARGASEWVSVGRHPDEIAIRLGKIVAARVTVFDGNGKVVGDSVLKAGEVRELGDDQLAAEVVAARTGAVGTDTRFSMRAHEDTLFVAVPIDPNDDPRGLIVRLAAPLTGVKSTVALIRERLLATSIIVFALAVILALAAARVLTRPLVDMRDAAHKIAGGNYNLELGPFPDDEFGDLAKSLKSLAHQLDTRISEIVRMEEMRRQFLDDITHEISTPVAAISGYAETLLDESLSGRHGSESATRKEFLEVIDRHARRIGRLVADLRFISNEDARPPDDTFVEPVPVALIAKQVVETVAKKAAAKNATIDVAVADDVFVNGDPDHVERVMLNLVDNAVKYGKAGGTVRVRATKSGQRVSIEIVDDGPGIPSEHAAKIFDRFYRVDRGRSRDQGGSGLGLAIVKQLVVKMGGTASVTSEKGQGARFVVELPAGDPSVAPT